MKRFTILLTLLFLFCLSGCDQGINLNEIVTQEITTEPIDIQNAEEPIPDEKIWTVAELMAVPDIESRWGYIETRPFNDLVSQAEIIIIVGYVGWKGDGRGTGTWHFDFWSEPVGNYEDMWKKDTAEILKMKWKNGLLAGQTVGK